jgi:hypothetical protein
MSWSFKWPLSISFPHQNPVCTCTVPMRATCPPTPFFSVLSPEQYRVMNALKNIVKNVNLWTAWWPKKVTVD